MLDAVKTENPIASAVVVDAQLLTPNIVTTDLL